MTNPTDKTQATDAIKDDIRVSDATDANWVDRFCPLWSRPYLRLSRADRPAGTWLLLIPCWWGLLLAIWASGSSPTAHDFWLFCAFPIGAFVMRGAGCTWNDITDRHIDAQVARTKTRPLPSGQVTVKKALIWMGLQIAMGGFILLTFNWFSVLLGAASLILVAIYPFAKRFTWWPQIFLGLAFNWGALMGWSAHTGSLTWAPVFLYLAGILWTLFYDTIYALQDIEDDALIGVKSTARLFANRVVDWLRGFMILTLIALTAGILSAFQPQINLLSAIIAVGGIWAFGWHLAWQLRKLDVSNTDICLMLFRSNRTAGLILVMGFVGAILAQYGWRVG